MACVGNPRFTGFHRKGRSSVNDPLTKPSRTNRKMKRRWKKPKISELIKSGLTDCYRVANLVSLSPHVTVRAFELPCIGRYIRPLLSVVFLCPQKRCREFSRDLSVMAGCIEQPLKRLAGAYAGSSNSIHSVAQLFELVAGGTPLYIGIPA